MPTTEGTRKWYGPKVGGLGPRHDGWYRQMHSVQAVARGSVEETPATFRLLSPLPGDNPTACARWSRYVGAAAAPPPQPAGAEFQMVAFICQGVPKCGILLSSAKRAHTHATGLPKERRPGRCICMCRSGKLPLQRLMSSLCMSAAATDLSSICLFCSAVCLNQHKLSIERLSLTKDPTRNCLAHTSHHHPISYHPLLPLQHPVPPARLPTSTSTYS
jgi:hypothetical protein